MFLDDRKLDAAQHADMAVADFQALT